MPDPTFKETAPVMLAYGNAVFAGQLLEEGLRLLLDVVDEERKRCGGAPRKLVGDPTSHKTIGILFQEVLLAEHLSLPEQQEIRQAARVRNILVHSYWDGPHTLALQTPNGRHWLVGDLEAKRVQLRAANALVTRFVDSYLAKYGHSVASLASCLSEDYEPDSPPPPEVLH